MAEATTLLAYLVPRLTNRVEDAATDSLAFILNKSAPCLRALDRLLQDGDFSPKPISEVQTQVTYEDGSRPDMAGYDQDGFKRLVVEAKFWASLGQRQANGYFGQLEEGGPGLLLFIAPDSRIETLWAEIRRQMESGEVNLQLEPMETTERTRQARIVGSDKRVMLVSWDQLLGGLAAAAAGDTQVASDIQQLRGLARHQDEEAFQPIHPEEFGLALPRRIRGLNRLIDDVVNPKVYEWMDTQGLNATPQREGYGRYFRFTGVRGYLFFCVNYQQWATNGDTPLWLWIHNEVPVEIGILRNNGLSPIAARRSVAGQPQNGCDVPIHLITGVEYDSVVDDVVRQIREIADMIGIP